MLIIKNVRMPQFKLKLAPNAPDSVKSRVSCVAAKGQTITIPNDCIEFVNLPHLRRCERHRMIKLYSIVEHVKPVEPVAVKSKPEKPRAAEKAVAASKDKKKVKMTEVDDA